MKGLGIIDIGSNSVRMLIAEIDSQGSYKIVDELKESVRLGAEMLDNSVLNEDRINKAINTLKTFKNFCDSINVEEIVAVATEAVRKSKNKTDFLERVKKETSITVKVLTGDEEAYYDYLGVVNSMYITNSLVIDLGGASTEFTWIKNGELIQSANLPFGAVTLTQQFNMEDIITSSMEEELKKYLEDIYKQIPWLADGNFDNIIGIGGTVRNIGKIDRKNKRYPLDIHHNYAMSDMDVHNVYYLTKSKNLKQRKKIEGLSKDRADIFVAPVCSVLVLMDLLKVQDLIISGKGLREGILYDYISSRHCHISDVLDYSINSIMFNHNIDIEHAKDVFRLTSELFNKLQPLHHLDLSYNNIIKTAAMLHDCGLSIRYYDHHKHSFYIILNSELNGLTHKELIMSAFTAAYHRHNEVDVNILHFNGIINRLDLTHIEKVGCLLRIAESLDKSMSGFIKGIECAINKDNVILNIISEDNVDLEIKEAKKAASFFNDVFDRELIIEQKLKAQ